MEVLPTPASPTKTGLFLDRLPRIRIVRSSWTSRPTSGSRFPSSAAFVRSSAKRKVSVRRSSGSSSLGVAASSAAAVTGTDGEACSSSFAKTFFRVSSALSHRSMCPINFVPRLSSCAIKAFRTCSELTIAQSSIFATCRASSKTFVASCVSGISTFLPPVPVPTMSWSFPRASCKEMPTASKALHPFSLPSARIPTTSISVPT
mmetsp:Transcript_88987/g.212434  ORF Transcript_88987/g.212434 Transcript_88987/m.212434 type:complete len:204 (-) Transcript_88987:443-1054(-)